LDHEPIATGRCHNPRACGVSSTPRTLDSITNASGILDRPPSRTMTPNVRPHSRGAVRPRFASTMALFGNRGRREDRVHAAPAVSRAIAHKERAHEHTGSAETLRPSLRSGFTAYFELSPVNGSFATVVPQEALLPKELDASTAASGPHDFAVRFTPHSSDMASASTATCPNVRDDGRRPSGGTGWRHSSFDLPDGLSGIFFARGLDSPNSIERLGEFRSCEQRNGSRFCRACFAGPDTITTRP